MFVITQGFGASSAQLQKVVTQGYGALPSPPVRHPTLLPLAVDHATELPLTLDHVTTLEITG